MYFACGVKKTSFFYGVSGASAGRNFILAMLKTFVFTWFWAAGGDPGRKDWHLKYIDGPNMAPTYLPRGLNMGQHRPNIGQHGPNIGPTWAQDEPNIAQHGPNLAQDGPNMAQHGPDLAQHKPKMGARWLNMGLTWPNMGTTCAQHRPCLLPYRQALRIMPASIQHSRPLGLCGESRPTLPTP